MLTYFIGLIIFLMFVGGAVLLFSGYSEQKQEITEGKNMSQRFDRASTVASRGANLFGTPKNKGDSLLDASKEVDKEFARQEEQRAMANRTRRQDTLLPSLTKYTDNYDWLAKMEDDLTQARSPWRATELMAASIFGFLVVFVLLLALHMGFMSLVALAVLFTPWLYIKAKRAAYYRKFDDQLSDALMLMSNSLRAGFSFMQAMEMVGREAPAPICEEFRRVTQEIALGVPIGDALQGMSIRIRSTDLDLVVTAVIIQREVGGALAQLLELIASVIRERQRIKGEIRTLTSQGRLTGMILGLMPFIVGFLIIFVGRLTSPGAPSFIEPLIATSLGHIILAGAFIWEAIGFWLIMRIVNIKV